MVFYQLHHSFEKGKQEKEKKKYIEISINHIFFHFLVMICTDVCCFFSQKFSCKLHQYLSLTRERKEQNTGEWGSKMILNYKELIDNVSNFMMRIISSFSCFYPNAFVWLNPLCILYIYKRKSYTYNFFIQENTFSVLKKR